MIKSLILTQWNICKLFTRNVLTISTYIFIFNPISKCRETCESVNIRSVYCLCTKFWIFGTIRLISALHSESYHDCPYSRKEQNKVIKYSHNKILIFKFLCILLFRLEKKLPANIYVDQSLWTNNIKISQ